MTKTYCDRCGKEIPKDEIHKRDVYGWITHRSMYATLRLIATGRGDLSIDTKDCYICPECEDSFIHWFQNPKT